MDKYTNLADRNLIGFQKSDLLNIPGLQPNIISETVWLYQFGIKKSLFFLSEIYVAVVFNDREVVVHQYNSQRR